MDNTMDSADVLDFTSNPSLSGTPSPWAVFDAWGAGGDVHASLGEEEMKVLSDESVASPFTPADRESISTETEILETYDKLLKRRSSVHFGYPYNLMYDHKELHPFMKYSINNLGDPFVTSNYGVHSRQFEVAVVDFFAKVRGCEE